MVLRSEAPETDRVEVLVARTRVVMDETDAEGLELRPLVTRRPRITVLSSSRCLVI